MGNAKYLHYALQATLSALDPAQILVVDRMQGPADVLIHTVSLLAGRHLSVTLVENHVDALRALRCCAFDLVVVGLEPTQSLQLIILSRIHEVAPNLPILVVGRTLPHLYKQYARHYGAREVLDLPDRAADLKALVHLMFESYLDSASLSFDPPEDRRASIRSKCREAV